MRAIAAGLLVLAVAGVAQSAAPRAKPAPIAANAVEGKRVFDKWCSACHADSPRLAGTLALKDKYKGELPPALEKRTDLTPEIVGYFVRNGVAWMAPFRKTEVSDADLAALSAYLSKAPAKRR